MNLKEKYAGKSFAEIAETISKKYKNREIDPVQKRSFETEINALKDLQETYRLKESIKDKMKMAGGGMLSTALSAGKGITEAFAGALTVPMKAVGGNITGVPEDMFGPKPLATNLERGMQTNLEVAEPEQFTKEELKQRQKNRDFYMKNPLDFESDKLRASRFVVDEALAKMKSFKGDAEEGIEKPDGGMTGQESTLGASSPTFNNEAEETKEPSKIGEFLRSAYGPMGVGKGIEMLGKAAMLAGGYDKFSPNYNPFEQEALNLMRSQGIDTQAVENKILAQQEAAMAGTGNVRSAAVQQALQQGINVNTSDALANAELQQQQMRNQLSSQMANALNVAGQQRVAAEDRATALTSQSKAGYQESIQNMLEGIGATGQDITEFKQGLISNALTAKLLQTENVSINEDCIADYQKGKSISSNCIQVNASPKNVPGADRTENFSTEQPNTEE